MMRPTQKITHSNLHPQSVRWHRTCQMEPKTHSRRRVHKSSAGPEGLLAMGHASMLSTRSTAADLGGGAGVLDSCCQVCKSQSIAGAAAGQSRKAWLMFSWIPVAPPPETSELGVASTQNHVNHAADAKRHISGPMSWIPSCPTMSTDRCPLALRQRSCRKPPIHVKLKINCVFACLLCTRNPA